MPINPKFDCPFKIENSIFSVVDPYQNSIFSEVDPYQNSKFSEVDPYQNSIFSEVDPYQNVVTNLDMFQFTMKGCMESCNRCGSKVYIFLSYKLVMQSMT